MVTIYENNHEDKFKNSVQESNISHTPPKSPEKIISDNIVDVMAQRKNGDEKLSNFILHFLKDIPITELAAVKIEAKTVQLNNTLGKLANIYEKIRNAVEYKGEHVLRRNAIERMLKRLAWEQESSISNINTDQIAENLIKELIWARYLQNKSVPINKISEVSTILNKYFYIIHNMDSVPEGKSVAQIRSWIFGIASSEVENCLDRKERNMYIRLMQDWFQYFFHWDIKGLTEEEKSTQIYLAVHRALIKSDEPIMRYHLLLESFPQWELSNKSDVINFINIFPTIYEDIENKINFSGKIGVYRRIQRHTAAFEVLREIVERDPSRFESIIRNEQGFEQMIRIICKEKYDETKERVSRGIIRSILYIFATKVIFVLLLEVPYEVYKFGDVRFLPLTMNIVVPPLFMFFIGLSIKTPDNKNTNMIIDRLKTVVYKQTTIERNSFTLHEAGGRSTLLKMFGYFYSFFFLGVFVGVGYLLTQLGFTLFGLTFFFVFLSLVLLFSYRIKFQANQMKVESEDVGLASHLFDYLTLPFLNLGFFLSKGLSKLNFLTIILDFLIEAPLKSIIGLSEEWTSFIKDKKDKVVEVPE